MKLRLSAYFAVFLFGLGDMVTTYSMLGLGFVETRVFFVPFLASGLFCVVLFGVDRFNIFFKEQIRAGLLLVALSPVINNVVVFLS
jgi:hypothetical protein